MADDDLIMHSQQWLHENCGTNMVDFGECTAKTAAYAALSAGAATGAVRYISGGSKIASAGAATTTGLEGTSGVTMAAAKNAAGLENTVAGTTASTLR